MDTTRRNSNPPKKIIYKEPYTLRGKKHTPPWEKVVGDMLVARRVRFPLKGETHMDHPFNEETTSRNNLPYSFEVWWYTI